MALGFFIRLAPIVYVRESPEAAVKMIECNRFIWLSLSLSTHYQLNCSHLHKIKSEMLSDHCVCVVVPTKSSFLFCVCVLKQQQKKVNYVMQFEFRVYYYETVSDTH